MIIGREIAVTALRSYAQTRGVTMPALPLGKLKMAMQVAAILLLLLGREQIPQLFAARPARTLDCAAAGDVVSAVDLLLGASATC